MKAPTWLGEHEREWVEKNGYLLEEVFSAFADSGEWPEPVQIQRELRTKRPMENAREALDSLPRVLGFEEWNPRRVVLTIFGIGCCRAAEPLLEDYRSVGYLALGRFEEAEETNRLRRSDVDSVLSKRSPEELNRLSWLLMADAFFLGSGSSQVESWEREIDPQVVEIEGTKNSGEMLGRLAAIRRIGVASAVPNVPVPAKGEQGAEEAKHDPPPQGLKWPEIATGLAAIVAIVVALVAAPPPVAGGLVGAGVGLAIVRLGPLAKRRLWQQACCVGVLALAGALVGLGLNGGGRSMSRYFVTHGEGGKAVIIPRIEPQRGATTVRDAALIPGDQVTVRCLMREGGEDWAQLKGGAWMPLALLSRVEGESEPPAC
jgi:hypothetical protein